MNTHNCGIHIKVVPYSKGSILVNVKMHFIEADNKIIFFSFLHPYLADEKYRRKENVLKAILLLSPGQGINKSKDPLSDFVMDQTW